MPLKALAIYLYYNIISLSIYIYTKEPNIYRLETSSLTL